MKMSILLGAALLFGLNAFAGDRMSNELMVVKTVAFHYDSTNSQSGLNPSAKIFRVGVSDYGTRVSVGITYRAATGLDWEWYGGNFAEDGTELNWGWSGAGVSKMTFPVISHELFVAMTSMDLAKSEGSKVLDSVYEVSINQTNVYLISLKYKSGAKDCVGLGQFKEDATPVDFNITCTP